MTTRFAQQNRELLFPAVILGISVLVFLATFQIKTLDLAENHDPGSRALPWIIAGALLAGGLFEFVAALTRRTSPELQASTRPGDTDSSLDLKSAGILLGSLLIYFLAVPWLGFFICTTLFSVSMMRLLGTGWIVSTVSTLSILLTVYLLFVRLFQVQLPSGAMRFSF
ncbi:MAG: tripartite tricarboxylate transporter TctB family protein [Verrucomicrobia bacterium]|nr:tripartite tricarboxylate transporter TctB family protein [Verrucomicrobiota bacterium]